MTVIPEECAHCTPEELALFQRMLESGQMSIFRTAVCFACKAPIPAGRVWCSIKCMQSVKRTKGVEKPDETTNSLGD